MRFFILGLRRSGTTIFWETFCQDSRFKGYNEPFNQTILNIMNPSWRHQKYYKSYREILSAMGPKFWEIFSPISLFEELQTGLTVKQIEYLKLLHNSAQSTCYDMTRCHFKMGDLNKVAPDAVLVHLYRPPKNFVTSVLLPSDHLIKNEPNIVRRNYLIRKRQLKNTIRKKLFWYKRHGNISHGFGRIIGDSAESLFALRLKEIGLDPHRIYSYPTVGRLLAYWKVAFEMAEEHGRKYFGDRFLSINFHDFCRHPKKTIEEIYNKLNSNPYKINIKNIRPPKMSFEEDSGRWKEYYEELKLPDIR